MTLRPSFSACLRCAMSSSGSLLARTAVLKVMPSLGLISAYEDSVIRTFWGYGENNCNAIVPNYSGAKFKEALLDLRDYMNEVGWAGTFYFNGMDHTKISSSAFYTLQVDGVRLVDWYTKIINGEMTHVAQ